MSDDKDQPQGPTDPHGPGGIDAPAPPGGPQRTDAPSGTSTPGEPEPDTGEPTRHGQEPVGGESDAQEPTQDEEHRSQQEENAATALDQPSDGSGGE
ncbi:MAG: hypothetical protein ACJ72P_16695 [Nocardioides sp.]